MAKTTLPTILTKLTFLEHYTQQKLQILFKCTRSIIQDKLYIKPVKSINNFKFTVMGQRMHFHYNDIKLEINHMRNKKKRNLQTFLKHHTSKYPLI